MSSARHHLGPATEVARTAVLGGAPAVQQPSGAFLGFPLAGAPEVTQVSTSWAGYLVHGGPGAFTTVEARWTEPAADCTDAPYDTLAAIWVGLDGSAGGKGTVQQTGTVSSCTEGEREYTAWFEMWPDVAVFYNDPVEPGDRLWARVEYIGNDTYELFLRNITKKWTEVTYAKPPKGTDPKRASAEVIVEAGMGPRGTHFLTKFARVAVTSAKINGKSLGDSDAWKVIMKQDGVLKATTSGLTGGGSSFRVTWKDWGTRIRGTHRRPR
ncbi:G1 family glutamic endopeptidase [Kitasatospora sp. NPDC090091]|uniref:G1 family glutamic endopeptidase n=1 Tax=Kitasatospora sp. NPDC090091 TaxID=3364081 RepID=UPI00381CF05F